MYVYIHSETNEHGNRLYTVGFYDPSGKWVPESDHTTCESAAGRVAYLNGSGAPEPLGQGEAYQSALAFIYEDLEDFMSKRFHSLVFEDTETKDAVFAQLQNIIDKMHGRAYLADVTQITL